MSRNPVYPEFMKRFLFIPLFCMALLPAFMPLPAVAQAGNPKVLIRESMHDLQRLGVRQREAFIAEMYNLLFMEGAGSPFNGQGSENVDVIKRGKVVRTVNIPYRAVVRGACFIGSNGTLYDYYETGPHARDSDPRVRELWLQAKRSFHLAGKQRMAPHLAKQIKELETRRAVHLLGLMPPLYRQALFAELYGLCYMENGTDAHAATADYELEGEHISHKAVKAGAQFLDAEGIAHDFHRTHRAEHPGRSYHWECVKFCYLHGHMEAFTPFREEVEAMRKHREEKVGAPQPTKPAEQATEHARSATPTESLMGSTTMPGAERPLPPAGDVEAMALEAAHYLRKLTPRQRDTLLAEVAGLLFMEDGRSAYKGDRGYDGVEVKYHGVVVEKVDVPTEGVWEHARFIGTDGTLCDFYSCLTSVHQDPQALEAWGLSKLYIHRAGKEAVFKHFKTELDTMKRYHATRGGTN